MARHDTRKLQRHMTITPAYRLLMWYDIRPEKQEIYFHYMLQEFVPSLQKLGLYMIFVWQIDFGPYPTRQIEFICESRELLRAILGSEFWKQAETRIRGYTTNYGRKVVRFQDRFQF
jgi:hypothetical protein